MRLSVAAVLCCLGLVAGAVAAPLQASPAPLELTPVGNRPGAEVPPIPGDLATFDVTTLAPAITVLPEVNVNQAMKFVGLIPLMNITWVEKVLPYLKNVDPKLVGKLGAAIIEPLQKIDPNVLGGLIPYLGGINWKSFAPIIPEVAKLDVNAVEKLVPAINAFKPEVVARLLQLTTKLTPETYSAVANLVNLGAPGINGATDLTAAKLNLLPGVAKTLTPPEPKPYVEPAPGAQKQGDGGSTFGGMFSMFSG